MYMSLKLAASSEVHLRTRWPLQLDPCRHKLLRNSWRRTNKAPQEWADMASECAYLTSLQNRPRKELVCCRHAFRGSGCQSCACVLTAGRPLAKLWKLKTAVALIAASDANTAIGIGLHLVSS